MTAWSIKEDAIALVSRTEIFQQMCWSLRVVNVKCDFMKYEPTALGVKEWFKDCDVTAVRCEPCQKERFTQQSNCALMNWNSIISQVRRCASSYLAFQKCASKPKCKSRTSIVARLSSITFLQMCQSQYG